MCGILGYVGFRSAQDICLQGLRRLEYRGYDSAGISVVRDGAIESRRSVGKLDELAALIDNEPLTGSVGIGHTRWATHGKPSLENCHPHAASQGRINVVHNGIIENYQEIRAELSAEGIAFQSQTDTEAVAHLIEKHYAGDLRTAVRDAVREIRGAFALAVVSADHPDEMVAIRRFSPLVIGLGRKENYVASDMGAIRAETARVYVIDDDEICRVSADDVEITDLDLNPIDRAIERLAGCVAGIEEGTLTRAEMEECAVAARSIATALAGLARTHRS